jgi:hypothetical protein
MAFIEPVMKLFERFIASDDCWQWRWRIEPVITCFGHCDSRPTIGKQSSGTFSVSTDPLGSLLHLLGEESFVKNVSTFL